ncbi:pogo transposable element with KRAB domain [Rhizophagus clarus]|uniref:Pogo transposable element with KRAB domain n=1 Tax=Rhizophagus clarus TaxID=94130 RepID=A0A8H3LZG7_9GLOM|nr:pogo transposable element with KRAB domain [Rhizophagus clarus]
MRRKNLSNYRHTTIAQCLPDDLVEKQQEFLSYIMYRRIQYDYPLAYISNMDKILSLLVLDSFSAHIVDSVKRRFGEKNTNIAVISGGLIFRLQPLDVSVNKSFKTKMRQNYNKWMAEAVKELTPAGNLKKPSYETVANWVRDSWNAVDVDLIRKFFKCCGISNKRDGTEDDWIFNYNRLGQGNQLGDEVEILSDDERSNEEDKEGRQMTNILGGEEDKEEEYEGEKDGYNDEYYDHYNQGTNYVNV